MDLPARNQRNQIKDLTTRDINKSKADSPPRTAYAYGATIETDYRGKLQMWTQVETALTIVKEIQEKSNAAEQKTKIKITSTIRMKGINYFLLSTCVFLLSLVAWDVSKGVLLPSITMGITGVVISLTRRRNHRIKSGESTSLKILANDYMFTQYATLPILSIVYAFAQGACLGIAASIIYENVRIAAIKGLDGIEFASTQLTILLGALATIVLMRIIVESYVVIYKTAKDISYYARQSEKTESIKS